jgi:hypothetical protein
MRVHSVVLVGAFLSLTLAAPTSSAQSEPWVGTWKLNVAKSKYSPGPAPKASTLTVVAAEGGFKQTIDTTPATGAATHGEVTWKLDDKDYPVTGNPNADVSAYTKIDARSYQVSSKKAGKPTITTRVTISADGKTRTAVQTGTDAAGQKVNNTIVYEKQ